MEIIIIIMAFEMLYVVYLLYSIDKRMERTEKDLKVVRGIIVQDAAMRDAIANSPKAVFLADSEDGWEHGPGGGSSWM